MSNNLSIEQLQNASVVGQDGEKIGDVGQVYVDDSTGNPSWVTVRTGLFGTKETFIPLDGAAADGSDLRVPYEKHFVKDAPNVDEDEHLSPEQEAELYRYYGVSDAGSDAGQGQTGQAGQAGQAGQGTQAQGQAGQYDAAAAGTGTAAGTAATSGLTDGTARTANEHREGEYTDGDYGQAQAGQHDAGREGEYTDGNYGQAQAGQGAQTGAAGQASAGGQTGAAGTTPNDTDEDIVLREERLKVGTESRETGRVRLRKHIVTEEQTVTVPVQREEISIEREPIADGQGHTGGQIGEDAEIDLTVHEEVPVVEKEVVDSERIGIHRHTVTDEQTVSDQVRREEVDIEQEDGRA